ncbi:MAG: hypothetical protein M1828_005250 [Chrysothrix sp. TS-e1954]|nr:MAG: hypothetical protein M1828_005250 [Chrysothrix sp. TS-e1954]
MKLPDHPSPYERVPFTTLMNLEKINDNTYRSTSRAFTPRGRPDAPNVAYGGHVYTQAVWAAAQTVKFGFMVHSVTGFFILPSLADHSFTYTVRTIRDGRSFCIRAVDVTQDEAKGLYFTCTCSFSKSEPGHLDYQERLDLAQFDSVLAGKQPQDHPDHPNSEMAEFLALPEAYRKPPHSPPFPGLITKKVDMRPFNHDRNPGSRRQLSYHSAVGPLPPVSSAPNLHVCAHLYASDRNSLFHTNQLLEVQDKLLVRNGAVQTASLSHTVIIHVGPEDLDLLDAGQEEGKRWFLMEAWTDRMSDGRGVYHSKIWGKGGRHVATSLQDGMVRLAWEGEGAMRRHETALRDRGGESRL